MLRYSRALDSYMKCLKTAPTFLPPKSVMRPDGMHVLWRDCVLLCRNGDC